MGHGSVEGAHTVETVLANHVSITLTQAGGAVTPINLVETAMAKVRAVGGILTETSMISMHPSNHVAIAHLITTLLQANLNASNLAGRGQSTFYSAGCARGLGTPAHHQGLARGGGGGGWGWVGLHETVR